MSIQAFLQQLSDAPTSISFQDTIAAIEQHYQFTPVAFTNGSVINQAGENAGSCKILYFAQRHQLTPEQTLQCFGDFYRKDVLEHPEAHDHQNIRQFIQHGWAGVAFTGEALVERNAV